ncbi:MAG TPA: hypothetical protein EYP79_00425, partial [Campylobacterales bacterium]|nr:hypothetical protein [Campylobacterales bacterium]
MFRYILYSGIFLFLISGCSHRFEDNPYSYRTNNNGNYLENHQNDYPNETIYIKQMKLTKINFQKLEGWNKDNKKGSLEAFTRGCKKNRTINIKEICEEGNELHNSSPKNQEITRFFENYFIPYKIIDRDKDSSRGLVTGYYVPFLKGSLKKTKVYKYPIYAKPRDFRRPYLTHREIDKREIDAKVICWVDDRVERFFLHIQGSGMVKLRDGSIIGVGYAEKNGYSYTSIGTYIHRKFKVPLYKLSA